MRRPSLPPSRPSSHRKSTSALLTTAAHTLSVEWHIREGDAIAPIAHCATVRGPVRKVLLGERVALNTLARCSGIATRCVFCASAPPAPPPSQNPIPRGVERRATSGRTLEAARTAARAPATKTSAQKD